MVWTRDEKYRGRCSNEITEVSAHREIGRSKLRWSDVIQKYMNEYREKKHKTG